MVNGGSACTDPANFEITLSNSIQKFYPIWWIPKCYTQTVLGKARYQLFFFPKKHYWSLSWTKSSSLFFFFFSLAHLSFALLLRSHGAHVFPFFPSTHFFSYHFMGPVYSYFCGHYSTLFVQNHGCKIPFIPFTPLLFLSMALLFACPYGSRSALRCTAVPIRRGHPVCGTRDAIQVETADAFLFYNGC